MGRVANIFYDAAAEAWRDHQEVQQQRRHGGRLTHQDDTTRTAFLDDFGIPTEEDAYYHANNGSTSSAGAVGMEYTSLADHHDNVSAPTPNGTPDRRRRQQGDDDFVFLDRFRLRPAADGWGVVSNLDLYFGSLYNYYYSRGLVPILASGVVQLVTLFFTLWLSVFLFAYVDWKGLSSCIDESTCGADFIDSYIIKKPFARWSLWNALVILYCLLFLAYSFFAAWSFTRTIGDALQAKYVFEDRLGISARKLAGGAVDWDRDVVTKILELQQSGEYRIAIHGEDVDALVIAQRIMRKENFLVALFNRNLLDLSVPGLGPNFFCASLEWSIYFCVLNFMFNHKYKLRPAFYLDPSSLRRRFMLCGIVHAIFMPFLLLFLTLHFSLQNAYDWKASKRYLGPREWSLAARWTFREFNELPHHFERRLGPSYEAAEGYLSLFGHNELVASAGRILVFVGGSLGAVLFVFGAMNDAILLHVKIADWNLLWFLGVVGGIYSAGKTMVPSGSSQPRVTRNLFAEIETALQHVSTYTHFCPDTWKGRAWDKSTHGAFSSMFQYKAQLFVMEVASVILAPYVLCVSLAKCVEPICEFILAIRTEVPGAGDVCGYATFDFDKYGDELWEGRTIGRAGADPFAESLSESVLRIGNVDEATRRFPKPKAWEGKMEKSFFSFKTAHPNWKCPESGQNLVDRVEQYQREETAALGREQQLHIEAAARQLDTLARLEGQRNYAPSPLEAVDDSYIPKTQATADTGTGTIDPGGMHQLYQPPSNPQTTTTTAATSTIIPSTSAPTEVLEREEILPPFAVPNAPPRPSSSSALTPGNRSSSAGELSMGLSSELRRILNMSTLDVSVAGSLLTGDLSTEDEDRRAGRQYLWLERYHAHVATQQRELQQSTTSAPVRPPNGQDRDPKRDSSSIV